MAVAALIAMYVVVVMVVVVVVVVVVEGQVTYSIRACRASWPIFSISSLLRRGLMVRASPSSYSSSSSFISTLGLSRGIMMVPLDFLLPRRGRVCSVGSFFIS